MSKGVLWSVHNKDSDKRDLIGGYMWLANI